MTRHPIRARRRSLGWVAVAVVVGSSVLAGCGGTGFNYVKSSSNDTYFKVPDSWKLFDREDILEASGKSLSPDELAQARASSWETVFDANPKPSISHWGSTNTRYPVGQATVEMLSPDDADTLSLSGLRNMYVPIDDALNNSQAVVLRYQPVQFDGGFHGIRISARVATPTGGSITFDQISVVDSATSKRYALFVVCTTVCFSKYQSKIEQIMSSWTVRDS